MIDVAALAKELLDAVAEEVGESAVVTVKGAEHARAKILAARLPIGLRLTDGDKQERARLRQLECVVLNQLGTTDPREIAEWIVEARASRGYSAIGLGPLCAALEGDPSYVARCAPQADGATEQDVIGLPRGYTASVDAC